MYKKIKIAVVLGISFFMLCGCSSIRNAHRQKEDIVYAYLNGRDSVQADLLDKVESAAGSGDEAMWLLEYGGVLVNTGNFAAGLAVLERAENIFEEYDRRAVVSVRDVAAEGGAVFTNLNALPYRGMMRDRIMLNMYKSFARLALGDRDNFRVEINRMRRAQNHAEDYFAAQIAEEKAQADSFKKQLAPGNDPDALSSAPQKIADTPQIKQLIAPLQPQLSRPGYGNFLNPAAIALSGISYWSDGDSENALVEFTKLYTAFPASALVQELYVAALKRAGREVPENLQNVQIKFSPGNAVYVFTAANRGPAYRQEELELILPYVGYTGIAFPVCETYPANFKPTIVKTQNGEFSAQTLADVNAIAAQEYMARLPGMITRMIISYVVKEGGAVTVNEIARHSDNDFLYLGALLTTSIYKYLFNTADTRCWELIPAEISLTALPMPSDGKMQIILPAYDAESTKIDFALSKTDKPVIVYINAPSLKALRYYVFYLGTGLNR